MQITGKIAGSLLILILVGSGCSEQATPIRHYKEIRVIPPPPPAETTATPTENTINENPIAPAFDMLTIQDSAAKTAAYTWRTPDGWKEQPGTGMRLATLHIQTDNGEEECTIIQLSGDSGSLEANVRRWLEQIGLSPSAQDFNAYIQTLPTWEIEPGLRGTLIDFAPFVSNQNDLSTLAAIIGDGQQTLFLKLMGSAQFLKEQQPAFAELAHSVTRNQ